ncbi:MAG: hypothetical protein HPY76_02560 [Anaerolineae bacterium]|jgi:hypothetical protein|nr:hypothetical protein [Anaerolineae bacterium]
MLHEKRRLLIFGVLMLLVTLACNLSFGSADESSAQQTLQAIYMEQTLEAFKASLSATATEVTAVEATTTEVATAEPTATVEIKHVIIPGEPGWVTQWWMDTDSSNMASQKRAYGGDYLNQILLERPFTAMEMLYRPDVDLLREEITSDANFFYFILEMSGVNPEGNMLAAHYGVELDFDKDGRGDLLLWALGDGNSAWNIDNVSVYRDTNNDVGGRRPILADAPGYSGDSYEQVLFSPDNLADPDAAWKRVDPADPNVMQLAIKKSLLENQATFMWNGWADAGVSDPTKFDYNDTFTLGEAGSPISGVTDYPLKALYLVDNTCRLAYGFTPTGNEPGGCAVPAPTPTTVRVVDPPTEVPPPPCTCSDYPNYTFIDDAECCAFCGHTWTGNPEFPCDQ